MSAARGCSVGGGGLGGCARPPPSNGARAPKTFGAPGGQSRGAQDQGPRRAPQTAGPRACAAPGKSPHRQQPAPATPAPDPGPRCRHSGSMRPVRRALCRRRSPAAASPLCMTKGSRCCSRRRTSSCAPLLPPPPGCPPSPQPQAGVHPSSRPLGGRRREPPRGPPRSFALGVHVGHSLVSGWRRCLQRMPRQSTEPEITQPLTPQGMMSLCSASSHCVKGALKRAALQPPAKPLLRVLCHGLRRRIPPRALPLSASS
jgi:hypothetical protein